MPTPQSTCSAISITSAAALAMSAKREVPCANGRADAGSAADFLCKHYVFSKKVSAVVP